MRYGSIRIASASTLALMSGAVEAQVGAPASTDRTAPDPLTTQAEDPGTATATEDIVVTGFRRSLDLAAEIKRDADVVSDVISAEDIGEFPDQNLAESLQRVTGVQITRSAGEGSGVSIRGLPSEFTRVQYNGRTLGSGGTRSFDFTAFSALFTSAVEVLKSPTSSMIDGGLSGTVNVRSAQPLDVGRTTVSASVEGVYEELSGRAAPRGAVLGNWVNASGTFGVNLGFAYEQRRLLERFVNTYGAETSRESPARDMAGNVTGGGKSPAIDYNVDGDFDDTYSFTHGVDYWNNAGPRTRITAIGGYQAKPTENLELYGDVFYTRRKNEFTTRRAQTRFTDIGPRATGSTNFGVRSSVIDTRFNDILLEGSQGFVREIDVDGVSLQATTREDISVTSVFSAAQGVKWTSGDFTLEGQGSYFKATNRSRNAGFTAQARASAKLEFNDGLGVPPTITYNRGFNQLDPANFYLTSEDQFRTTSPDRNYEGRIDATVKLDGFVRAIKVGGYFSDRRFVNTFAFRVLDANDLAGLSGGKFTVVPGIEGSGGIAAAGLLVDARYPGIPNAPQLLSLNLDALTDVIPRDVLIEDLDVPVQAGSGYDVSERSYAFYVETRFATDDDRLSGNLGLRYVRTSTTSIGISPNLNGLVVQADRVNVFVPTAEATQVKGKYDYVLPSFNARYNLTERLVARFAAARMIGRPNLGSLSAGTSVDANVRSIYSGNPDLKPYKSDQADISLEYYLPKGGLLSIAGFYKHLADYILNGQTTETYTVAYVGGSPGTLEFRRNQPLNLANGDVKGVEVAAQLPLDYLTEALDGFGVFGNYTYIQAPKIPRTQGGQAFSLDGVAKHNYNVGAYFEKGDFGIRGSYSYRGTYSNGGGTFGDGSFTRPYAQLDGSISYKISDAISASLDATNLLNRKVIQENSFGLISYYSITGPRYTAGFRIKF